MRRQIAISVFVSIVAAVMLAGQPSVQAQPAAKTMGKDEVFFGIARRINAASESPVSAVVSEVDSVIEITGIAMEADGKALVTVKERTPPSGSAAIKSTRLKFAPPASGDQWTWLEFEENRKFYPVEKLFPYTKGELEKRSQLVKAKWAALVTSIEKQAEAGGKVLDTAKAVLKTDPPMLGTFATVRAAFIQAVKDNDSSAIINGYRELAQQADPIVVLGDTYNDLKANDAYLRLLEEYKGSITATAAARRDYVKTVEIYNESIQRLPFSLVAYGLQYTKIEPNLTAE